MSDGTVPQPPRVPRHVATTMTVVSPLHLGLTLVLLDDNRVFADVLAMRLLEEPQVEAVAVAGTVPEAVSCAD